MSESPGKPRLRVLGVDTSLRSSGVAVLEARGNSLSAVEYGAIKTPSSRPVSQCLLNLQRELDLLIKRTGPTVAAIEGVFYSANARTTIALGEARGVVIVACAAAGVPVYEYAPRRVKQALVGYGAAHKQQVRKMITRLLGLDSEPDEDAADALAIAICHLHNISAHEIFAPKEI